MIKEIKKNWFYIIAFIIINFLVLNIASIMSEPLEVADLVAPMILFFQIIAMLSSFFAALVITIIFVTKISDFKQGITVIMLSVLIFSVLGAVIEFSPLLLLQEENWEQGYLTEVLTSPYELSLEQFKTLTFFNAIQQIFSMILINSGGAFFGFIFARQIINKSK